MINKYNIFKEFKLFYIKSIFIKINKEFKFVKTR